MDMDITLHVRYRYKPDNSENYTIIYPENSISDVKVLKNDKLAGYEDASSLKDILSLVAQRLANTAPKPELIYNYTKNPNIVYPKGTIISVMDTGEMYMADGKHKFGDLPGYIPFNPTEDVSVDIVLEEDNGQFVDDASSTEYALGEPSVLKATDDTPSGDDAPDALFILDGSSAPSIDDGKINAALEANNVKFESLDGTIELDLQTTSVVNNGESGTPENVSVFEKN